MKRSTRKSIGLIAFGLVFTIVIIMLISAIISQGRIVDKTAGQPYIHVSNSE